VEIVYTDIDINPVKRHLYFSLIAGMTLLVEFFFTIRVLNQLSACTMLLIAMGIN